MTASTPSAPEPSASATPSAPAPSASGEPPLITTTPGPIEPTGEAVRVPPARWDAIVADLAARGITGTPELVSSHAVTWRNGALGCPQPGMSYTQALVDGMRVVVVVDGTEYDYRFGRGDTPRLCTR
ncbi:MULTISPECIES: hypothetical protein [Microbacterium]|uniref:hypothetical protein n=1 Tax=Microbacterium TaxID=33882 RepID=UPI001EF48202|nr:MULTISPECIES: hypothetical protein [Microbacterium]